MIDFPEDAASSIHSALNTTVDYTTSIIAELEKRVAKEEAFRFWLRELDFWSTPFPYAVRWFVRDRGYGPWYQREACEHVKDWAYTPHALDVFEYLHNRFPNLETA